MSPEFVEAVLALGPIEELTNWLLYGIHEYDIMDKHKLLIPLGNMPKFTSEDMQRIVPEFPSGLRTFG